MLINGKKPLIHIGYPKALSSWLQKVLFVPRNGFCKVLDSLTLQMLLIDAAPFSYSTDKAKDWVEKTLAETPNSEQLMPVITSEAMVGHTHCGGYNAKTNADRLFELCPEGKILIITREQKSEIRSLYKTFVIWGMPHSIKRILNPSDPSLSPQFNLDFLRYDLLVDYYQQLYGKDDVLVLPYEMFVDDSTEFLRRLFSFSELSSSEFYNDKTIEKQIKKLPTGWAINSNQTLVNLLYQRWHNYFFLSSPFNYSGLFASSENNLKRRIARSKKNRLPAFMDKWFEEGFSNTVSERCEGEFSESNRRLSELTGLDLQKYGYEL